MAELDLLTEIHSDVKYIKESLSKHIVRDDEVMKDIIRPLWENHQQQKGAMRMAAMLYSVCGGLFVGLLDFLIQGKHQ